MKHLHRLAAKAWDFCAELQEHCNDDDVLTDAFTLCQSLSELACGNQHMELLRDSQSDAPFKLRVPQRHKELAS